MYVKNETVKMDWEVDKFIENKQGGLVAAIACYKSKVNGNTLAVLFRDNVAIMLYDESKGEMAGVDDLKVALKRATTDFGLMVDLSEYYEGCCVTIHNGVSPNEAYANLGFSDEDIVDIGNRINDLVDYFQVVEESMN